MGTKQKPLKIAFLPDPQVKPDEDLAYLSRVGSYLAAKRPDVIVCAGDFGDMPSLSSYDKGKLSFEGRRYWKDVEAVHRGQEALLMPIEMEAGYSPRKIMLGGNHEQRILRAVDEDPKLEGTMGLENLKYEEFGWETPEFLEPVKINDVMFAHYFTSGVKGLPITSAARLLSLKHMSCVAGHQQGKQIAYATRADGATITGMIVGSMYEHNEKYLGPQGNSGWRGLVMLHEVKDGSFDEMMISLSYINKKFARK